MPDNTVPNPQPMGQASQIPLLPYSAENMYASSTRSSNAENVEIIKRPMIPAPRSTPSEMNFVAAIIIEGRNGVQESYTCFHSLRSFRIQKQANKSLTKNKKQPDKNRAVLELVM